MSGFRLSILAEIGTRHVAYLRAKLVAAHRLVPAAPAEMSLVLVDDLKMSQLHQRFMGIAGPTDVLTFPLDADARGRSTCGEVVICVGEARRQARQRHVPVERELLLYALHGLLHLCGFEDKTAAGFRKMHRTEDAILSQLGVGPVFAAAPRRSHADRFGEK